jgi:protein phosphatase
MQFAAVTHPGSRQGENQDVVGWNEPAQLWFIADGMGGYAHGQVASRLVKETLTSEIERVDLVAAVLRAHDVVRQAATRIEGDQRMGATVVCAQMRGDTCRIVWVGDSRAYLWRSQTLQRLTRDHSYVEALLDTESLTEAEIRNHPNASVVLQTLGMGTPVPSERDLRLRGGDWIMLCSDGVPVELRDTEIAHILRTSVSPQQAAQQLLDAVLKKGGRDNTSVVVVQHDGKPVGRWLARLAKLDGTAVVWIATLAGIVLAAAVAVVAWRLHLHHG